MKKTWLILALVLLILFLGGSTALADEPPYRSFSYTPDGHPFFMQSPYIPQDIIGQSLYTPDGKGDTAAVAGLRNPSDLFLDAEGFLYVADRDNHRIVKMTLAGNLIREYGVNVLRSPEGVYVTENGDIYVADTGNAQIVVLNSDDQILAVLGAPQDVRLENLMFTPTKVAVDQRGYIYVQLKGSNEGLMLMDIDGKFQGYFARNATQLTLTERLKRLVYTDEQIATNSNAVAPTVSGMCISGDGYVYTCTSTLANLQIKKFNASGNNLFDKINTQVLVDRHSGAKSAVSALYVDQNGIIYAIDNINGAVILYDATGKPLMMFGEKLTGNDRRIGYFNDPVAIAVAKDGTLLVLDRGYNGIHVFRPTTLMKEILAAVTLYNDGQYLQAEKGWTDILKMNANYYWANLGLGKIAYMNKDYKTAMQRMHAAMNQTYYSDALWKYRAQTVQSNAAPVLGALLGLALLHLLLSKAFKLNVFSLLKKGWQKCRGFLSGLAEKHLPRTARFFSRMRFGMTVIRHPIDTYYEATRRGRGSLGSALGWFVVFVAVMIGERALTNFVFDASGIHGVSLVSTLLTYVLPVLLWIEANYLVGAITKGQGTLKGIVISTIYALMPLILFTLPLALVSNALTLAEGSIYWIARSILYLWVLFLLFLQVKEIHGYEFGETIKNILWILFVAAMTIVAVLALAGIMVQAYNFLNEFFRELLGYV